jgi:hypothetical protein
MKSGNTLNAPGLTRRASKSMHPTRKFARLEFNRVSARKRGLYVLAGLIALFVTWALLVVTDVIGPGSRPLTAQQCAAARGVGLPHVDQNHPECRLR